MLEVETAFQDLPECIKIAKDLIKSVLSEMFKYDTEFKQMSIDTKHIEDIVSKDWPSIKYEDICKEFDVKYGEDISSETEKLIVDKYQSPVFITHYAKDLKPFYMKKDETSAFCFDLIFPEVGELIGGSQREDEYEILKREMEISGLDMEKMDWYLRTRKWGSTKHSGFGVGIERLVSFICKTQKIHDVIPFPISY